MPHNPEGYNEALARLNARQQARNRYTNIDRAAVLREIRRYNKAHGLLSCGHPPDEGHQANVEGKTVQGWTSVVVKGKHVCHACADKRILSCGHTPSPHSYITTGTAHTPDGREICCECADREQVQGLKDRSKPFGAYLDGDGRTVTTWTGGKLGTVTSSHTIHLARWSYVHGKTMLAIRVRDVHGAMWHGRTSPGMCVTLRPSKR